MKQISDPPDSEFKVTVKRLLSKREEMEAPGESASHAVSAVRKTQQKAQPNTNPAVTEKYTKGFSSGLDGEDKIEPVNLKTEPWNSPGESSKKGKGEKVKKV